MSDKKEIATLSIKISIDSTDLDKLEAQLKRIEGLMVSTGLKQPAKGGFITDFGIFNPKGCLEPVFTVSSGRVFINDVFIENGTIEKIVLQPAEEQTKKGAEQARFEITTGVNDNREQVSAEMFLKSSAEISRTSEVISREQSEYEKLQQLIEDKFNYLHSSITAIQHTQANSEIASANAIEQVRAEVQRKEQLDL
ncbi:hypothetical protein [Providencia rettgeri]|uniref:hypothetical protein n=1 Tax=Providencia rettgeri TaxID=587 RepID=UPI000D997A60|nr:hypothetical protein [Providencia rettgeri]PYZ59971.1 hypothetical protein DNK63_13000 [Providencia rettgeri]